MKAHLIALGDVPGTLAENVKVGDVLTWNWGCKSTVIDIVKRSAKSVVIRTRSHTDGKEYQRRLMFGSLVAANI